MSLHLVVILAVFPLCLQRAVIYNRKTRTATVDRNDTQEKVPSSAFVSIFKM